MPQRHLPFFPAGVTDITPELAFRKEDGQVTYFNGHMPVFIHEEGDKATFRMITSQFCVNGNVKQADIVRAFGVTTKSREAFREAVSREGACGVLCPTPRARAGGLDRAGGGRDRGAPRCRDE
jgi:hypothetical protein